mmetsp:Transcript_31728/g.57444  ORF Transcript_31728/g.57444 Transcript_31728/m.57444 type:complete len:274 (-) Transcript_31728:80-901(-)
MADLNNLLGDIHSDEEDAPLATLQHQADDDNDRERLDLPPALAEAARKQYQTATPEKESEEGEEEDGIEEDPDYAQLKRLWKQEMNTPELMTHDTETIGLFLELLEGQEETIDKLPSRMDSNLAPLLQSIYKMDADRVRFMLTDMTRARLDKLEAHPLYMREMVDRMSEQEIDYLKEYGQLTERHLRRTVLDHLPKDAWKKLDEPEMIDTPNLDQFVFCKVLETVEIDNHDAQGNDDDDDEDGIQEHKAGSCLIARYSAIRDLVLKGKIEMLL